MLLLYPKCRLQFCKNSGRLRLSYIGCNAKQDFICNSNMGSTKAFGKVNTCHFNRLPNHYQSRPGFWSPANRYASGLYKPDMVKYKSIKYELQLNHYTFLSFTVMFFVCIGIVLIVGSIAWTCVLVFGNVAQKTVLRYDLKFCYDNY